MVGWVGRATAGIALSLNRRDTSSTAAFVGLSPEDLSLLRHQDGMRTVSNLYHRAHWCMLRPAKVSKDATIARSGRRLVPIL
jgi:hypothetical protein